MIIPPLPSISLRTDNDEIIYRQLYHRFRDAIVNGSYPPGTRVPSIRTLAQQLNVSRNTVERAYDLLIGDGYFIAQGQAGTFVSKQFSLLHGPVQPLPECPTPPSIRPFQIGVPAQDAFPRKLWSTLSQTHLKDPRNIDLHSASSLGYEPLRNAIAAYLNVSRGIPCCAEQIIVTSGYRQSLQLLLSGLIEKPAEGAWIEDPCYPPTRVLLAQHHITYHALPVDAEGMIVKDGIMQAPSARVAIVTPTNQSPLGVMMSVQRRAELLNWAAQREGWIIEDDYDSEFCGKNRLAPALSSLDRAGRTFYLGTFSKTMFPALRLAYIVTPSPQIGRFAELAYSMLDGCPLHTQQTMTDMMRQGYYARHVKKMGTLYTARRKMLITALHKHLGKRLRISPNSHGLSVLAHLPEGANDVAIQARLEQHDLAVGALSPRALRHDYGQALLLGFANFSSAQEVELAVQRLAAGLA